MVWLRSRSRPVQRIREAVRIPKLREVANCAKLKPREVANSPKLKPREVANLRSYAKSPILRSSSHPEAEATRSRQFAKSREVANLRSSSRPEAEATRSRQLAKPPAREAVTPAPRSQQQGLRTHPLYIHFRALASGRSGTPSSLHTLLLSGASAVGKVCLSCMHRNSRASCSVVLTESPGHPVQL